MDLEDFIKPAIIVFVIALIINFGWHAIQDHNIQEEKEAKIEAAKWSYIGSSFDESNFYFNKTNVYFDGTKGFIEIKEITPEDYSIPLRCDRDSNHCDYNKKVQTVIFDCKTRTTMLVRSRFYDGWRRTAGPLAERGFRLEAANILNKAYRLACKVEQNVK